jgi:tRNA (guanine37-N1)-methyltransferase
MSNRIRCIKVSKKQGQLALEISKRLELIDMEHEIKKDGNFLYIPLVRQPSDQDLKMLRKEAAFEITVSSFKLRRKGTASLAEILKGQLPQLLLTKIPRAMDLIGDIAIIEIPLELERYKGTIGDAVLKSNKNIRTVLAKAGAVSGAYRLRQFDFVAGEQKSETVHKENGCQYQVDVSKTYFSPRLSTEHKRVASQVQENETVADLFAGVGPFAILIAKTHEIVRIYAIDANPDSVKYLTTNIRLNRVIGKVYPLQGDARQMVNKKVAGIADRIVMNLPEKAIDFLDVACHALKPQGGIVHFYGFIGVSQSLEDMKRDFVKGVEKAGRRVDEVLSQRKVRETSPHEWQAVLDASVH